MKNRKPQRGVLKKTAVKNLLKQPCPENGLRFQIVKRTTSRKFSSLCSIVFHERKVYYNDNSV